MSIAFRSDGLREGFPSSSSSQASGSVSPAHQVEPEAPERAVQTREAPESRSSRQAEAPDAGEGRSQYYEQDFTHGRSQS
jgi:hypothetical protein